VRRRIPIVLALGAAACGASTSPTPPSPLTSSVVIGAVAPAAGSTIVVPEQYPYIVPGGVVIPMLHMRNNGLNIPPTASETIAEATLSEALHLRREGE
jgi:hypothetical protein